MADQAKRAEPASGEVSSTTPPPAADLCPRCGITYNTRDGHTCAKAEARPELVPTIGPDPTVPADPLGKTGQQDFRAWQPEPPAPPFDELIGTVINDRFEIQKCLSRGGMGIVYLARHRALDTLVAIKVLLRPRSPDDQERFLLEAKIASKVRHPNTVYISDFGQLADGRNYLAMEFLKGRPLSDVVARGPLPVLQALGIAVQIARGLQAVHSCGIIHRDIKPANVLLVEQDGNADVVKIVDFGIAKVVDGGKAAPRPPTRARGSAPEIVPAGAGQEASAAEPGNLTLPGMVMGTVESFTTILRPPPTPEPRRGLAPGIRATLARCTARSGWPPCLSTSEIS